MSRRTKQAVYGIVYLIFWCAIGFGIYQLAFKPAPTCSDGKQNGLETGIDCGPGCLACEIKDLSPIRILPVKLLQVSAEEGAVALVELQNPNATYGAGRFTYTLTFYGANNSVLHTETGETLIYPSEVQYRVLVNLPFKAQDVSSVASLPGEIVWREASQLSQPKTQIRDLQFTISGNRGVITGIVRNENAYPISIATINGLVSDTSRNLVAASKTFIRDLPSTQEREFQIVVLLPENTPPESLTTPRVTVESFR